MTPWDLIVWALAASASLIIAGFGVGIAMAVIKAAQRS
jgi:hypothetical protein